MTLILAVKGDDFLILAGDSRAHYPKTGYYLDSMEKIFTYNDKLLVGGFGSEMFIRNLDYHFSRQIFTQKHEQPMTFEEMMSQFQTMAVNEWKKFTTSFPHDRKPSVGYLILGFDIDGIPQMFEVFSDNCFTPCIYTMSKVASLGTDSLVTTFGEDLLQYAEHIEDYKLAMIFLLWKTASKFSTVGVKRTKMIVAKRNGKFLSIESGEIDDMIRECERIDNSFWRHFYGKGSCLFTNGSISNLS